MRINQFIVSILILPRLIHKTQSHKKLQEINPIIILTLGETLIYDTAKLHKTQSHKKLQEINPIIIFDPWGDTYLQYCKTSNLGHQKNYDVLFSQFLK